MSDNDSVGSDKLPQMDMSFDGGRGYDPLNELMRAIILRVIDDYNTPGELREEAIAYLHDEEEEYLFSFRAITRHLGMDPDKTREYILNPTHKISTRRRAA
jgi:hypothetical protein